MTSPRTPVDRYIIFVGWAVLVCATIGSIGWFLTYGFKSIVESVGMVLFAFLSFGYWALLVSVFIAAPIWVLVKLIRMAISSTQTKPPV